MKKQKRKPKKLISICIMCGKDHYGRTPKICKARNKVFSHYVKYFGIKNFWKVLWGVENGVLPLEADARNEFKKIK